MKTLDELRNKIDSIDEQFAALLKERLAVSKAVAEYKAVEKLPIYQSGREQKILDSFQESFTQEQAPFARAFLKGVIRQSREYQYYLNRKSVSQTNSELKPSIIYFQGIPGSHSSICAADLFPNVSLCSCKSFAEVFDKINADENAVGVLPIDNSTAGTVGDVYDLLASNNLSIVHAITRSISHYLLAPKGTDISQIKQVTSHPQALLQCGGYIKKHGFIAVEASNTAIAAEQVAKANDPTLAAIASKETAKLYNLDILEEKINDENTNQTRFICISKSSYSIKKANRMSVSFDLPNQPGALADILSIFSDFGINLTKILSRPIPTRPWEYTFYLDCVYTPDSNLLFGMLTHLYAELPSFKVLGIYYEEGVR